VFEYGSQLKKRSHSFKKNGEVKAMVSTFRSHPKQNIYKLGILVLKRLVVYIKIALERNPPYIRKSFNLLILIIKQIKLCD